MKKTSILLILLLFLCIDAFSQKVAYAVFKDSTLTFYYDDKKPEGAYDVENLTPYRDSFIKEWARVRSQIKTAVFEKSFKKYRPKSCSHWFEGCVNLTSIKGIKNLNTSEVTDMSNMFDGCMRLFRGFNTGKVSVLCYGCVKN